MINGQFNIGGGSLDLPEMYYLNVADTRKYISLFLENSDISIEGDLDILDNVSIAGSTLHDSYKAHQDGKKPYTDRAKALFPKYDLTDSLGDKEMEKDLNEEYDAIYDE